VRIAYWVLAGAVACALAGPLAVAPASAAEDRVTLNFVNTEVDAVVRAVAEFTGRSFIVDPRVKGTMNLTIERSLTREQALAALTAALRLQGYAVVDSGGIMRVVPEADAKLQGGSVQIGRAPRAAGGDQLVTQVFRLNYESAANLVQVLRPLIAPNNTINAYPGNNTLVVTDYAQNVGRIARIIAAIDTPAGSGIDVVQLKHAIATDVAALLVKLLETSAPGGDASQRVSVLAEPSSNSLLIRSSSTARANLVRDLVAKLDQPAAAAGNIHVVHLKNAEAAQLARTLLGFGGSATSGSLSGTSYAATQAGQMAQPAQATRPAAGLQSSSGASAPVSGQIGGAQIQADPTTNTLIITAPDAVYRQMRTVIDQLDVRRAQVLIESLIVEVSSDQAAEFGIQWQGGLQNATGSQTSVIGGTNFGTSGQNIVSAAQNLSTLGQGMNIGVIRGQVTLPGVGTVSNLQMLARALESNTRTNILSTPNILTLDNEEAKIVVGQNVPFVTGQYVGGASATSATVNPFQTIERRDVGLTLRVRPQISEGGTVKLVIYQEVSSVQDTTNAAGIITNKRSIDTNVLVDDGAIVVLGGLIEDSVAESQEKVPLLGDIPLLGALFRYETRKRVKTNLMVFLRPFVVRDERSSGSLTMDRYDYMRMLQDKAKPESRLILPDMTPSALPPQGGALIPPSQPAEPPAGETPAPQPEKPAAAAQPAEASPSGSQHAVQPAAAPAAGQPAETPAAPPAAPQ
jgi:general secretion pathway protein D